MRNLIWPLAFALGLVSCASVGTQPQAQVSGIPRYDLIGQVNGATFDGVGVVPQAKSYNISISSHEDVDMFTLTSCHRDYAVQGAIQQGLLTKLRSFSYVYTPAPGIEDSSVCLIRIGSYNRSKEGLNGHAVLVVRDGAYTLPAENICDTTDYSTVGASICQSKLGLIQRIKFPVLVHTVSDDSLSPDCKGQFVDANTYEYRVTADECAIVFDEVAKPHRKHVLFTLKYTYDKIRGP